MYPNDEQIEELLERFCALIPGVVGDCRFAVGIGYNDQNGMFPFVSFSEQTDPSSEELPSVYIKVIKVAEGFRLFFEGFFIIYSPGVPSIFHPWPVSKEQLGEKIIWVWDQWLNLK